MEIDLLADGILATSARAAVGFLLALALLKLAKKRFLRGGTPLDTLLIVLVGAVLGRGIVEGEHFLSALAGSIIIVVIHYLLAGAAFLLPRLSSAIEGHPRVLIRDGVLDGHEMRAALIKPEDICEALRLRHGVEDLQRVKDARQERNGQISVVLFPAAPGATPERRKAPS